MKKLFIRLALYTIYALVVGEIIVRAFYLTADIPELITDSQHIQKYLPNQTGYHKGGGHKWKINDRGWAGPLPKEYDNLITLIGDSFIENFMNPDECHQSYYLKGMRPENNYLEAARSGVSLIEAMEIAKHLDSLKPKYQLIYMSDNDLEESIVEVTRLSNVTQVDLKEQKIVYGKTKSPLLKKIIYNWKFIYYLYRRFPLDLGKNAQSSKDIPIQDRVSTRDNYDQYDRLLDYIAKNYKVDEMVFVLRPTSSKELVQLMGEKRIRTIFLDDQGEDWTLGYDHHWSCFGHNEAAKQVAIALDTFQ